MLAVNMRKFDDQASGELPDPPVASQAQNRRRLGSRAALFAGSEPCWF
jgi:hypothetical protein